MTRSHLDDEALSAALDGAATAVEQAHLSSCSICQAHVESLAAVARAVGAPVADRPPSQVDDAIERAVRAWSQSQSESQSESESEAEAESFRRESWSPAAPTSIQAGGRRSAARRRGASPRWLGAVVGIAAAVIAVGVVVSQSRGGSSHSTTTAGLAQPSSASTTAPARGASASPGDLGDQSDPAALARLVTNAVGQRAGGDAAAAPAFGATTVAGAAVAPRDQLSTPTCATQAATASRVAGSPTPDYVAAVRWRGEPAVVVVFSRPGGLAGAVMRPADCSVLIVLPL
jgi:hypothetical protein